MEKKNIKLQVENLAVSFRTNQGLVQAVRGINFDLYEGETLAIVGESGSGKSVSSRTIMGILASNGFIKSGKIIYEGQDLTKVDEEHFHELRGNKIGMIFQDPMSSLNPIMRIGKQITEGMLLNGKRLKNKEKSIYKTQKNVYYELLNDQKALKENFSDFKKSYKNALRFGVRDIRETYDSKIDELKKQTDFNIFDANNQIRFNKLDIASAKKALKESDNAGEQSKIEAKISEYYQNIESLKADIQGFKQSLSEEKAALKVEKAQKIADFKSNQKQERQEVNQKIAEVKSQYSDPDTIQEKLSEISEFHQKKYEFETAMAELNAKLPEAKEAYISAKKHAKQVVKLEWADEKAKAKAKIEAVKAERDNGQGRSKQIAEKKNALQALLNKKEELKNQYAKDLSEAVTSKEKVRIKQQYKFDMAEMKVAIKNAKKDVKIEENYYKHQIDEIKEELNRFKKVTKEEAKERAIKIMQEVGIPQPEKRFRQYPFQFSGGMRQRIVIAIALTANPDVLICDEPTTALDVTIQAQILELINNLKKERNLSVIFITHDLGVVANMADRIGVMYAGKIVELGTAEDVFYDPRHPYTWALLSSMPDINTKERLIAIPGTPPNMLFPPKGDAFADRNQFAMKIDFEKQPPMFKVSETHTAATWLLHKDAPKVDMPEIVQNRINRMLQQDKKGVKVDG